MARRARHGTADGALSDIVGTTVVLAVTVIAVGAATVSFGAMSTSSPPTPRFHVVANATESAEGFITLQHTGGAAIPVDALEVVVSASSWPNATRYALVAEDASTSFDLGVTGHVASAGRALDAGDNVDVLVYVRGSGDLVASTSFVVAAARGAASLPLDGFTVALRDPAGAVSAPGGSTIFASAAVDHPGGRKAIERVVVDLSSMGGPREAALVDDATQGDATASDGVYSGSLLIPPEATPGDYVLRARAYDLDANRDNSSAGTSFTLTVTPSALTTLQQLLSQWENSTAAGTNGTSGTSGSSGTNGLTGGTGGAGVPGSTVNLTGPQGGTGSSGTSGTNGTAGAAGANGTSGSSGTNGTSGTSGTNGTSGTSGTNGTSGTSGSNGTSGTNGTNGTSGGTSQSCCGPLPEIDSIDPRTGPSGTIVRLGGQFLTNVSSVLLAPQGASFAYLAAFGADPAANAGEGLVFAIPPIPDGTYVVNVTRMDGAWATAPQPLVVAAPQPEIFSISPSSARSYTQVNVTGANFSYVTAVTLTHPTMGEVAVPWSILSGTSLVFVTHPGLTPAIYDVNVSSGTRWAIAPLAFEALTPLAPEGLSISPTSAQVEELVTLTGLNLDTISRVVLSQANATRIIEAAWYQDSGAIKIVLPTAAAPLGAYTIPYRVELTGSFDGIAVVPETLTLQPTPSPTINCPVDPVRGEPFTQVRVFGSNFVNVKAVSFGETPVYFTVTSANEIRAVTHAGLASGNYSVKVTTATGTVSSACLFQALPLKIIPIYNKALLSGFAVNLSVSNTGSNDQLNNLTVKLRAVPGWNVTGVSVTPVNFDWQTGSATSHDLSPFCSAKTVPSTGLSGVSAWTLGGSGERLLKYSSFANQLDYYFGVNLRNATTGAVLTHYVTTNTQTQNFILPAGEYKQLIRDSTFPTNDEFRNCNP